MVFVIVDSEKAEKTMLVKADNIETLEKLLKRKDTQDMVGAFTDVEITALEASSFAIISA